MEQEDSYSCSLNLCGKISSRDLKNNRDLIVSSNRQFGNSSNQPVEGGEEAPNFADLSMIENLKTEKGDMNNSSSSIGFL